MTTYVSQGNAVTYLRGGDSFNSSFLRRSFLNLAVKKNYENWPTSNKVLPFGARGPVIMTHRVVLAEADGALA